MADVTLGAFAGIRNTVGPERLHVLPSRDNPATDLVAAVNVDIDNAGQPSRRAGTTLARAGTPHSLWAQGDMCLFAEGASLKRLYPDYSADTLTTGLTVGARMAYVEVNGRIYWSNEHQTGVIADGRSRSWGMAIPPAPGLSAIAGQLTAGQYQCVVTHVRTDGQESGAALPSLMTLAQDGGLRASWPLPEDPGIELARVYLSTPDGTTLYLAAESDIADLYTEITDCRFALPLATQWQDAPLAGHLLAYSRGRIYIAQGAFIFATTALGFEYVDLRDYFAIDGTRLRVLVGVEGGLFAATERQAVFLAGERFEEMVVKPVAAAGGVEGSAVLVDGMAATGNKDLSGQRCALFATGEGVLLGLPSGAVMNLSRERYQFTPSAFAAGGFHQDARLNQYVLFLQG
jgi:hypothetical protein